MLLSSNGRTPVFQTDVDAGSIPVKSTKWSVRLARSRTTPFHGVDTGSNPVRTTNMALSSTMARTSPSQGEEGGSTPLRATKYWKVAEWLNAFDCKSNLFGVRGFESLPSNKKLKNILGG